MHEDSSRELDELRALVAVCAPVQVFGVLAFLWNEAATREGAPDADAELWTCAADAAREAAATLTGEDADAREDGEGEEPDDGEADDDAPEEEEGDEAAEDAPDDAPHEAQGAPLKENPAAELGAATTTTTHDDEDPIMARDTRLGLLPNGATTWRAKRADGNRRTGAPLLWDDHGVGVEEWPVRSLSAKTILDRWGPGAYVIQYIAEENGKRRPCGTSRILHITGQKDGPVQVAAPAPTALPLPAPPAPSSSPSLLASVMPPSMASAMPMQGAADPMFANVFAIMSYMNDQNERTQARAAVEARIAAERYRAELDAQLERERIASQERIALATAQAQIQAKAVRAAGPLDPDTLAEKIGAVIGAKLQESRDDDFDDDDAPVPVIVQAPAAPPDNTAKMIDAVKETLAPILSMLAQHVQNQTLANGQRGHGVDHAAE